MKKFIVGIMIIIAAFAVAYSTLTKPYEAIEGTKLPDHGHVMTIVGDSNDQTFKYYRQIWNGWDRYIPESFEDYYNSIGWDRASADHWTVMAKTW